MAREFYESSLTTDQVKKSLETRRGRYLIAGYLAGCIAAISLLAKYIGSSLVSGQILDLLIVTTSLALVGAIAKLYCTKTIIARFYVFEQDVGKVLMSPTSASIQDDITDLERRAENYTELQVILCEWMPLLENHLESALNIEIRRERAARVARLCQEADRMVKAAIKCRHEAQPDVRARIRLEEAITHLRHLVLEADRKFDDDMSKKKLKWFSTLTRNRKAIVEIENQIAKLETALNKLLISPSLIAAESEYLELQRIVDRRIKDAKKTASMAIPENHELNYNPEHALSISLFAGAASIPVSVALDLERAGSIYDALRQVNGNFVEMSDLDIWHETLSMPAESLVGLASLTKGAYFEKLVEHDFNGQLFSNFNHPDTDILIDGVAYQIKATDSLSYVQSVADHIPVIATSEVAEKAGAIDGGFSDVELSDGIDLALGGTVIDFGDTLLDAFSASLGGVGIVAILYGAHSAWGKYQDTGIAADALNAGMRTTARSTARSAVNLVEMVYRGTKAALTSRPVQSIAKNTLKKASKAQVNMTAQHPKPDPTEYSSNYRTPIDFPSDNIVRIGT